MCRETFWVSFLKSVVNWNLVRFLLDSVKVGEDHLGNVILQKVVLDLDLWGEGRHSCLGGCDIHELFLGLDDDLLFLLLDLGLLRLRDVPLPEGGIKVVGPFVQHLLQARGPSVGLIADGLVGGRGRLRLDGAGLGGGGRGIHVQKRRLSRVCI